MWWQVLPSMFLVGGFSLVPFVGLPVVHYVFTGRPTMRGLTEGNHIDNFQRLGYRRDWTRCGNEYESRGLDNITDDL